MSKFPKRGEIFWVSLDPVNPPVGSEIQKKRPGLILSNDLSNKHSRRVIIGPVTSSIEKVYPFEAKVRMPQGEKKVALDQIRSIDKIRLGDKISAITSSEMQDVERALKITLALP